MKKIPDDIAQQMEALKAETKPTRRKGVELELVDGVGALYDVPLRTMMLATGFEADLRKWAKENGYRIVKVTRHKL